MDGRRSGLSLDGVDHESYWSGPFPATRAINYGHNEKPTRRRSTEGRRPRRVVIDCHIKELYYGPFVRDTTLIPVQKNKVTAFIGSSGCGLFSCAASTE